MSKESHPTQPSHRGIRRTTAAGIVATIAVLGAIKASESSPSSARGNTTNVTQDWEYTVQPYDTLAGIADAAQPNRDERATVDQIVSGISKRYGLSREDAVNIVPGEVIQLPDNSKIGTDIPTIHEPGVR